MILPGEDNVDAPAAVGHFGVSYWSGPGERALIGYFPGSRSDRDRFTIAHELGHIVLHTHRPRTGDAELEANLCASALLMPKSRAEQSLSMRLNLTDYARLKAIWGVSIQALIMRGSQLGLVSEGRKESLFKQLSARGWRRSEPVVVHPEQPLLLWRLIKSAFGDASSSEIAEKLAIPAVVLRALAPRPFKSSVESSDTSSSVLPFRKSSAR